MKIGFSLVVAAVAGLTVAACGDDENVTKLTGRIKALEAKAGSSPLAGALTKAQERIKALEAKAGATPWKDVVAKAQARIKSLEAQNADLAKKLQAVSAAGASTAQKNAASVTALSGRLKSLESAGPVLGKSLSDAKASIGAAMAKLGGRVADLEKRTGSVSTNLNKKTAAIDTRLTGVAKDLSAIKTSAGSLSVADKRLTGDIDGLNKKLDAVQASIQKLEKSGASAGALKDLKGEVDKVREGLATMTRAISAIGARVAKLEKSAKTE